MTTLDRRFFAGESLPQAVMTAARLFGVDPSELAYRQIEKRHGFTKTRRRYVIEVDPVAPRRVAAAAGGSTVPPSPPVSAPAPKVVEAAPRADGEVVRRRASRERAGEGPQRVRLPAEGPVAEAVLEAVRRIFRLADLRLDVTLYQGETALEVDLDGEDREVLAEEDGEVLEALEYLVPRAARGLLDEMPMVRIDSAGRREARERDLRAVAAKAAAEVGRTRQSQLLPRMSPAERRVIHLALADDPGVTTESEGDGFFKRIRVQPR